MTIIMLGWIRSALLACIVTVTGLAIAFSASAATRYVYVDSSKVSNTSAPGTSNPGDSWTNAYPHLQTGLTRAGQLVPTAADPVEVWVAEGTYFPDEGFGSGGALSAGVRTLSFNLANNVKIYGGFEGTEAATPAGFALRSPETNITILSGDLSGTNGNDTSNFGNRSDNSYHVVTGANVNTTARLDGFRIRGGNATGSGDDAQGGGFRSEITSALIVRCVLIDNQATDGGGVFLEGTIETTVPPAPNEPQFINCRFLGNKADSEGGAIYNVNAVLTVVNAVISGNTAVTAAGYFAETGEGIRTDAEFFDCTFTQNTASSSVGAIQPGAYCGVFNCILWGDSPSEIAGSGTATVSDSNIQGGYTGTNVINSDPLFVDANGGDNTVGTLDDNVRLGCVSPSINTGNASILPADIADLNLNSSTTDALPRDLAMAVRV